MELIIFLLYRVAGDGCVMGYIMAEYRVAGDGSVDGDGCVTRYRLAGNECVAGYSVAGIGVWWGILSRGIMWMGYTITGIMWRGKYDGVLS